jgi:signal transduction histidine kinase
MLMLLFFAAGFAAVEWGNGTFEIQRFVIRGSYLVILSFILIWFGINRADGSLDGVTDLASEVRKSPVEHVLRHGAARLNSPNVGCVWWDREEPWIKIASLTSGEFQQERRSAVTIDAAVGVLVDGAPFLLDHGARKILRADEKGSLRVEKAGSHLVAGLAETIGEKSGLVIPFVSVDHEGFVVAADLRGMCADDLKKGAEFQAEASAAFNRASALNSSERAAETRVRLALARDIHDSVVQLLAGTAFRLQGIRAGAEAGRDIGQDVEDLQQELAREQKQLRSVIARLRAQDQMPQRDLSAALLELTERLSRQWGIECVLAHPPHVVAAGPGTQHDLHQLVREAVANAVRHAGAQRVEVSLTCSSERLELSITDTGGGFRVVGNAEDPALVNTPGPWSLAERVKSLGGSLAVFSSKHGSRILVTLPVEGR